jgi:hypothetical protein
MSLKKRVAQPEGGPQHEQNKSADQDIDQSALGRGFRLAGAI